MFERLSCGCALGLLILLPGCATGGLTETVKLSQRLGSYPGLSVYVQAANPQLQLHLDSFRNILMDRVRGSGGFQGVTALETLDHAKGLVLSVQLLELKEESAMAMRDREMEAAVSGRLLGDGKVLSEFTAVGSSKSAVRTTAGGYEVKSGTRPSRALLSVSEAIADYLAKNR